MKRIAPEFIRRGLTACGFGPLVLAVLYLILRQKGLIETLSVEEVCLGIFSLSALAFVAGGMNVIYQLERLPLMAAILIHGGVLYLIYLLTYLINGWLELGRAPITFFTLIFVLSYFAIWAVIYFTTTRRTKRLNEMLRQKQSIPGKNAE